MIVPFSDPMWSENYIDGYLDNLIIKTHHCENPLVFCCSLCSDPYLHWVCQNRVWHSLPKELHKKYLCTKCFLVIRKFLKLMKS